MITSNNFLEKHPLWNPDEQLPLSTSLTHDLEMGPWSSTQLHPSSNSFTYPSEIITKNNKNTKKRMLQIKVQMGQRYGNDCGSGSGDEDGDRDGRKKYSTLDFTWDRKLYLRNANPMLRRASHLPVISAREEYGDIFKYTRPLEHSESSTKSLNKSKKPNPKSKNSQKSPSKPYLLSHPNPNPNLNPNPIPTKYLQCLPTIQKYLSNKNKCYDIYESCLKKVQKSVNLNTKPKHKGNYYRFV